MSETKRLGRGLEALLGPVARHQAEPEGALQELPVPDRLKWVPQAVRDVGRAYDVGQMWVNFAKAIRSGTNIEPDFDHAVRRHRMLDAVVRASETGQRQKVVL